MNTGFDRTAHKVDVRRIAVERGRYNIQNIAIFLWSLNAYSLTLSPLAPVRVSPTCFRFSSLGLDEPLFNNPIAQGSDITAAAQPFNVPDVLRRRVLCRDIAQITKKGTPPVYYEVEGPEPGPLRQGFYRRAHRSFPHPGLRSCRVPDGVHWQISISPPPEVPISPRSIPNWAASHAAARHSQCSPGRCPPRFIHRLQRRHGWRRIFSCFGTYRGRCNARVSTQIIVQVPEDQPTIQAALGALPRTDSVGGDLTQQRPQSHGTKRDSDRYRSYRMAILSSGPPTDCRPDPAAGTPKSR